MKSKITLFIAIFLLSSFISSGIQAGVFKSDSLITDELTILIQDTFDELKIPGMIVGIWKGDDPFLIKTMGVSDIKSGKPIMSNDKMRIGSITKTFTGTVLLQLADEGKISISDKLSKYFPDFPNGDNITIEMLGNMRSGIFNYSEDNDFAKKFLSNLSTPFTPDELISIALKHEPYFPPGTSFHYSNTNTVLLGLIIEKLTGNSLKSEIENRILIPLDMKNTFFAENTDFPDPHGHGYMFVDSLSDELTDVTVMNPSWGWAAGALISDIFDVKKYAGKLATGQLISRESQEQRLDWGENKISESGPWKGMDMKYGFAIADMGGAIGHNGGIPGYNSFMGYIPEKDVTIIILADMQDNKEGKGPADYMSGKIIEKVMSK